MLDRLACLLGLKPDPLRFEPALGLRRSGKWPAVRAAHLKREPCCQLCGTTDNVEVHHIQPVHLFPELELGESNMLSLCRPHHFLFGHYLLWSSYNPQCREDCADWRLKIRHRPAVSLRMWSGEDEG